MEILVVFWRRGVADLLDAVLLAFDSELFQLLCLIFWRNILVGVFCVEFVIRIDVHWIGHGAAAHARCSAVLDRICLQP